MSDAPAGRRPPKVALVTCNWGEGGDEETAVTRLVAGALSRRAEVEVVHLKHPPGAASRREESVFVVHEVPLRGARRLRAGLMRAALHAGAAPGARGDAPTPGALVEVLESLEGRVDPLGALFEEIAPEVVLACGEHQPWDPAGLAGRGVRLCYLPLLADTAAASTPHVRRFVEAADAVASVNPGERGALARCWPGRAGDFTVLPIALPLNRGATAHGLFGVRFFLPYVLSIRAFPPGGPRFSTTATHEVLQGAIEVASVAEIDGETWRIGDRENTMKLPVNPTRVNLWRLMAHAVATVDLRPQGPLGREAIESLLLGTPVVVPDTGAAAAHVAESGGGLVYGDEAGLIAATRALMDPGRRAGLSQRGLAYAEERHGSVEAFTEALARVVLG